MGQCEPCKKPNNTPINKCSLCSAQFDLTDHKPLTICSDNHKICQQCINKLQGSAACPFCKQSIEIKFVLISTPTPKPDPSKALLQINKTVAVSNVPSYEQHEHFVPPQQLHKAPPESKVEAQQLQPLQNQQNLKVVPVQLTDPVNINQKQTERAEIKSTYPSLGLINEQYLQNSCCTYCQQFPQDKQIKYLSAFIMQLIIIFFDLLFASHNQYTQCMDRSHGWGILVVRPWLLGLGVTEIVLTFVMLLGMIFYRGRVLTLESLNIWQNVVIGSWLFKTVTWSVIELLLFRQTIVIHCTGGVYAYGVALLCLHGFFYIALLMYLYMSSSI